MPSQALYRKWRSQNFDEVVGQTHIVRTLRNALRDGRVAHAYLFTGPRGTGKTSTARILAKAVNCEAPVGERPCNHCAICRAVNEDRLLDLVEIDAASHTGVDAMRETVIDRINFRPTEARFRIYIIDEVHMLSTSSFNALLKTLEEPPPHVIFILATTDVQKVPATVISRCQRFDFHRIGAHETVQHLQAICQAEGRSAEPGALTAVARYATGSMRDAITLLDQLMAYGADPITVGQVEAMLGTVSSQAIGRLVGAIAAHDAAAGLTIIADLVDSGVELRELTRQTIETLRQLLLLQVGGPVVELDVPPETRRELEAQARLLTRTRLLKAIRLFTQASVDLRSNAPGVPQLTLEMAVVEACQEEGVPATTPTPMTAVPSTAAAATVAGEPAAAVRMSAPVPSAVSEANVGYAAVQGMGQVESLPVVPPAMDTPAVPTSPAAKPGVAGDQLERLRQAWPQVKELLQSRRRMILGVLTGGVRFLAVENNQVIIGYDGGKKQAQYNASRLLEPANKVTLEAVLSEVLGESYTITVIAEDQYRPTASSTRGTPTPQQDDQRAVSATPVVEPGEAAVDPLIDYATRELGAVATHIIADDYSPSGGN